MASLGQWYETEQLLKESISFNYYMVIEKVLSAAAISTIALIQWRGYPSVYTTYEQAYCEHAVIDSYMLTIMTSKL